MKRTFRDSRFFQVVTIAAKNGETLVPVPGSQKLPHYERLYPNDFVLQDDVNVEYLNSGRTVFPGESSPVEYAADALDEDWLSTTINPEGQDRLSISNFEKMIWRLELANSMITQHLLRKEGASITERKIKGTNYAMQHLTKVAALKLLNKHEGIDLEVIELVYDYWIQKRQNLKTPLLRTLQPKTAANDRNPDHTFREREKVKRPNTRRRRHISRADNAEEKLLEIKDEMAHVCNIFKSMVNRESLKAHVVNLYIAEKRTLLDQLTCQETGGPDKTQSIRKEQEKRERYLKKDDAEYRAKMSRFLLQNVFCGQLRKMFVCSRGFEADADPEMILSKRIRRAEKRRQKVISFLVQDRNWQKWHDTTWMHQMFLTLRKRSIYSEIAKSQNQKKLWKKWEKFVKQTRDEKIKQLTDGTTRKKPSNSKQRKTNKSKDSTETDSIQSKPQGKKTSKKSSAKAPEKPLMNQGEDSAPIDGTMLKEVSKGTLKWALEQGIQPPTETSAISREIIIPQTMIAPQLGFPCLPPRLKEMYSEAEKDATSSPDQIIQKTDELKSRRDRILELMKHTLISRSEAIAQNAKETNWKRQKQRRNRHRSKIKKSIREVHSNKYLQDKAQRICNALVSKLSQNLDSFNEVSNPAQDSKPDLPVEDEFIKGEYKTRRKGLKICKAKIYDLKKAMMDCKKKEELIRKGQELRFLLIRFWKLKFHKSQFHYIKDSQTGTKQDQNEVEKGQFSTPKKVTIVRRRNHRVVLDLMSNGQSHEIPLNPRSQLLLTPFQGDFLDPSGINDYLSKTTSKALPSPLQSPQIGAKEVESKHRKVLVGLSASRRLLRGKGVSPSTLLKRHKLRRMMLNPVLSRSLNRASISDTKLRKLGAIREMKLDVPRPPEKRPYFAYSFKLDPTNDESGSRRNSKFLTGIPDDVLSSGIARIGRGNRIWIDRADPVNFTKLKESPVSSTPNFQQLPVLQRVLKGDQFKKSLIHKHNKEQKKIRRETEEEELKKAAVAQESHTEVMRRQENFLPHWSVPASTQNTSQDAKRRELKLKRKGDRLKEAQRIQGTVMEMGLKLPLQKIFNAIGTWSEESPVESSTGLEGVSFSALDQMVEEMAPSRLQSCPVDTPESSRKRRKVSEGIIVKSEPNIEGVGWVPVNKQTQEERSSLPKIKTENSEVL